MPMDRSRADEVQASAPTDKTEKEKKVARTGEDEAVVVDPEVDYDPFRGQGGEYEIDEEGVRVQVEPPTEPVPLPPDPDAPVIDNTLPEEPGPEGARNTVPEETTKDKE